MLSLELKQGGVDRQTDVISLACLMRFKIKYLALIPNLKTTRSRSSKEREREIVSCSIIVIIVNALINVNK